MILPPLDGMSYMKFFSAFALLMCLPEMSIAAEKLPLPHRDVRKKNRTRRCRHGFQKNVPNFTAATVLDQKYWY
jgi:hypothetical protein